VTKQLRQTILPTHILGAAGTAESDALGYFSLVAGSGITLTPASGSLSIAATGSGTVTSVGLSLPNVFTVSGSPVTGSGTLTATLATQAANQVFVGPSTGANAAPTFRALLPDDIPALTAAKISDFNTAVQTNRVDQLAQATQPVTIGSTVTASGYRLSAVTTSAATTLTLDSTHNGAILRFTASSAVTITIPTGLSSSFSCSIIQEGTGQITITPDAGVTRNAFGGATKTAGRYAVATLIATASNTFILGGQVVV
jgi:hypothetical protein